MCEFSPIRAGAQPRNTTLQHEAEAPTAPIRILCILMNARRAMLRKAAIWKAGRHTLILSTSSRLSSSRRRL